MDKITSFTIDHIKLQPGLYVSRKDKVGAETVTTFDLRLTKPNDEPVMNTAEVHTIEHLAATYLRNEPVWKDKVLYFGPMGCRTGFYLLLTGDYASKDVVAGTGLLPLHPGLSGRGAGCKSKRLRQLPGHEPVHGKLLGQKIRRTAGKH